MPQSTQDTRNRRTVMAVLLVLLGLVLSIMPTGAHATDNGGVPPGFEKVFYCDTSTNTVVGPVLVKDVPDGVTTYTKAEDVPDCPPVTTTTEPPPSTTMPETTTTEPPPSTTMPETTTTTEAPPNKVFYCDTSTNTVVGPVLEHDVPSGVTHYPAAEDVPDCPPVTTTTEPPPSTTMPPETTVPPTTAPPTTMPPDDPEVYWCDPDDGTPQGPSDNPPPGVPTSGTPLTEEQCDPTSSPPKTGSDIFGTFDWVAYAGILIMLFGAMGLLGVWRHKFEWAWGPIYNKWFTSSDQS